MSETLAKTGSFRIIASSLSYSAGLFSLTFSFPLLATSYGYSYSFIGFLGVVLSIPFIVVAYLYTKLDYKYIHPGTIFAFVGSLLISLVLLFRTSYIFIYIYVVASIVQAFWWITSEISLSLVQGEGNAEKYSAGWGVPNAIVPIVAGVVVQFFGFNIIFVAAAFSFAIGLFFIPKYEFKPVNVRFSNIRLRYVFSLLFAGISMGFIFFVIVPVLKYYEISYTLIGVIVGIFGGSSAAGYVLLNFMKDRGVKFYSVLSSLLVFPTFIFGLTHQIEVVAILMVSMGLGTAIAMSKILSYVSGSSSARLGVFYYEAVFGVGAMIGSFGGGTLFQYFGGTSIVLLFILPLIYIITLLVYDREPMLE